MALERTAEMRYLGLAQLKTEGGQTQFDNGAGERYIYNQEHTEIGLGYAIHLFGGDVNSTLAASLSESHKWLSPHELEHAKITVDGQTLPFDM